MAKAWRGVKEPSRPLTPQEIRAHYADRLRELARRFYGVAEEMEQLHVSTISPSPGGMRTALEQIEHLLDTQFETKVRVAARRAASRDIREKRTRRPKVRAR